MELSPAAPLDKQALVDALLGALPSLLEIGIVMPKVRVGNRTHVTLYFPQGVPVREVGYVAASLVEHFPLQKLEEEYPHVVELFAAAEYSEVFTAVEFLATDLAHTFYERGKGWRPIDKTRDPGYGLINIALAEVTTVTTWDMHMQYKISIFLKEEKLKLSGLAFDVTERQNNPDNTE